jgi:hypothetical protein
MNYSSRYPGVKPFETAEQHIFFGRTNDIQTLYELVGVEKTVLLYSKSGLGKSSLINAGLIPRLRDDKRVRYTCFTIRFGVFSKENNIRPKEKIIQLLKSASGESKLPDHPDLLENSVSFWLKALQLNNPENTFLLVFDQFEELFTYPEEQILELKKDLHELLYLKTSPHFRDSLFNLYTQHPEVFTDDELNLLSSAVNARLLFAIRSDFLSMLNRLTDYLPNLQRTFYELKPLEYAEARNAIVSPAAIEGDFPCPRFAYSQEAVEKIIAALSDHGKQPIETFQLQIVCQYCEALMLKNRNRSAISADDLGDIREIHQSFYNNLMAGLPTESEEEKIDLRILLEEQFIYEPEQRRLQVLKGIILKHISERTLLALERTHLIRSEPYQDSFTYELSHDTLVEPILKSYRIRKAAEEQKENEKRREAELVSIRAKARRQRNLIVVVSVAAIFSAGFAIFGFTMWNTSEKALKEVEFARRKAESAVLNYEQAEIKRKAAEVNTCLDDARSFEMYGKMDDARRSVEKALQIDPSNKQAVELMNKYKTGK